MEQENIKPRLLKVLLILTFIGSGLTMFSNLFLFGFFNQIKAMLAVQGSSYSFMGTTMDLAPFFQISSVFYLIQGLLSGLALTGAIFMWDMKKIGFHFYALAQISLLIVPKLFIRGLPFPGMELLISFLFVYLYYKFLKVMH
jgi:hypothetical protein